MARNVIQYDLLISCPGDIESEHDIIKEAVSTFNDTYSDVLGVSLRTKHWSKDSFSQSGDKPQNLLNKQFVVNCDAAIALFWTRFGTPTDRFGSGTEEEIEEMLKADKQVFMYFSDKPIPPSLMSQNQRQYKLVQKFKNRYKDRGMYFTYSSDDELKKMLTAHLGQYFLSLKAVNEISSKQPQLILNCVGDSGLNNSLSISPFYPAGQMSVEQRIADIENLIDEIKPLEISSKQVKSQSFGEFNFIKPILIDEDTRSTISTFCEARGIAIDDDFFALGSMHENTLETMAATLNFYGSRPANGEKDEIRKYNAILKLERKIIDTFNWMSLMSCYENYRCIKFVVQNIGTTYDEDVELTLSFPKKMLIMPRDLPIPEPTALEYFLNECDADDFFGIPPTSSYSHYDSSRTKTFIPEISSGTSYFPGARNYTNEYNDAIDDTFHYDFFEEQDNVKVKIQFDYLKHNTAIAFPTILFVTDKINDVQYSIISKHIEGITTGIIGFA